MGFIHCNKVLFKNPYFGDNDMNILKQQEITTWDKYSKQTTFLKMHIDHALEKTTQVSRNWVELESLT